MKFLSLASLIILVANATEIAEEEEEKSKEDLEFEEYLRKNKEENDRIENLTGAERKAHWKDKDDKYELEEARNELIALNGIPIDWCVAEDKKRHVVAKAPGALCLACSECTRNHWKEASKFITEESK